MPWEYSTLGQKSNFTRPPSSFTARDVSAERVVFASAGAQVTERLYAVWEPILHLISVLFIS